MNNLTNVLDEHKKCFLKTLNELKKIEYSYYKNVSEFEDYGMCVFSDSTRIQDGKEVRYSRDMIMENSGELTIYVNGMFLYDISEKDNMIKVNLIEERDMEFWNLYRQKTDTKTFDRELCHYCNTKMSDSNWQTYCCIGNCGKYYCGGCLTSNLEKKNRCKHDPTIITNIKDCEKYNLINYGYCCDCYNCCCGCKKTHPKFALEQKDLKEVSVFISFEQRDLKNEKRGNIMNKNKFKKRKEKLKNIKKRKSKRNKYKINY